LNGEDRQYKKTAGDQSHRVNEGLNGRADRQPVVLNPATTTVPPSVRPSDRPTWRYLEKQRSVV